MMTARLSRSDLDVKQRLTPNRRTRRTVENGSYAAFARRIIQAHGRRIASGDIDELTALVRLADDVNTSVTTAVTGLRDAGYSWAEIVARLDMTRQAAQQRWGEAA